MEDWKAESLKERESRLSQVENIADSDRDSLNPTYTAASSILPFSYSSPSAESLSSVSSSVSSATGVSSFRSSDFFRS